MKLLGVFEKFQKETFFCLICLSVCPAVCIEQLGSHWMDSYEI
jgi:hypothetical protein